MDKKVTVQINTIEKVKQFVNIISKYENDAELQSQRYIVDAKSIMGIFSLDLSKNITLVIREGNNDTEKIVKDLEKFIVK